MYAAQQLDSRSALLFALLLLLLNAEVQLAKIAKASYLQSTTAPKLKCASTLPSHLQSLFVSVSVTECQGRGWKHAF
jgi:hypothetical protein